MILYTRLLSAHSDFLWANWLQEWKTLSNPLRLSLELTLIAFTSLQWRSHFSEVKEPLQLQEDKKDTLVSRVPCVHIGQGGTDGVIFRSFYIFPVSFSLLKNINLGHASSQKTVHSGTEQKWPQCPFGPSEHSETINSCYKTFEDFWDSFLFVCFKYCWEVARFTNSDVKKLYIRITLLYNLRKSCEGIIWSSRKNMGIEMA